MKRKNQDGLINELGPAASKLVHPCRIIFNGRSTMGKTTLAVDVVCKFILKDVKRCYAACPTFWDQPALTRLRNVKNAFFHKDVIKDGIVHKKNVFTTVNNEVFEEIYRRQKRDYTPAFLYVDDAAAESSTNQGNKGAFARLCLAAPHLNLTIVGCFQRITSCSPAFRDNCEALISFIPTCMLDIDIITKEFNPCPAESKSKEIVKRALVVAWNNARFCFILKEAFTGKIYYYAGFNREIKISK